MRRRLLVILLCSVVLFALGLGAAWRMGSELVAPRQRAVGAGPAIAEEVRFERYVGGEVVGWWIPGKPGGASGVVILLHPLHGDRRAMLGRAGFLARAGYDTLMIDLQAHGENVGEAITAGWRARHDVVAAVHYAETRTRGPIGVIGWSLGGAATLLAHGNALPNGGYTAALKSPYDSNYDGLPLSRNTLDAVVLESVYPTLDEAIENRIRMRLGPLAPALTPLLTAQLPLRMEIFAGDVRPIDHFVGLHCPVLVLGGTTDTHTTEAETRRMFAAAREPKQLLLFEGAEHTDLHAFAPETYEHEVLAFLAEAFAE